MGLDRERVRAGIPMAHFEASRVPGSNDQLYFYANRHTAEGVNVTLAFYQPHPENPFYHEGVGFDQRGIAKSVNRTQTAQHVTINRLRVFVAGAGYDMHWLGNNGRLTLRLDNPPTTPPPPGPSPQTGVDRNLILPIIILSIGAFCVIWAEVYRRKLKSTSKRE